MIKINDTNIFVGYIKQLLTSFNLPTCRVLQSTAKTPTEENTEIGDNIIYKNYLYSHGVDKDGKEIFSKTAYNFGDFLPNLSKKLEIQNNKYDSYTHSYLGNYLRFIRDYKNIDLMSMYNCFTGDSPVVFNIDGESIDDIINRNKKLQVNNSGYIFNTKGDIAKNVISDNGFVVFALPIKFNQVYTIGLDWTGECEIFCGFYKNGSIIYRDNSLLDENDNNVQHFMSKTYQNCSGVRLRHPVIFDKLTKVFTEEQYKEWSDLESIFTMFIRVPKNCLSSIVVLEGNYLYNTNLGLATDKHPATLCSKNKVECYSKLQLLQTNNLKVNLLADRLIEYLMLQAIYPMSDVEENISKLQYILRLLKYSNNDVLSKSIKNSIDYQPKVTYGIWDEKIEKLIKYIIYQTNQELSSNTLYDKFDLIGYCDKDIEKVLTFLEYVPNKMEGSE